ncbi:MAG: hypothetical protein ABIL09_27850 [Gemmatimonadota bacterium]
MRARVQPKQADQQVDDLRMQHQHVAREVKTLPFQQGKRLTVQIAAAATTVTSHGLRRKPTGWIKVDVSGDLDDVYRTSWDDEQITLAHPGASTINLVVMVF